MNLLVRRRVLSPNSTIGDLYVDAARECFTLEDPVREIPGAPVAEWKIPGQTAIPVGRYEVVVNWSNRFKMYLPMLLSVPGFTGIRIHRLNKPTETEGCIGVGRTEAEDWIGQSGLALDALLPKIETAIHREKVWIEVA